MITRLSKLLYYIAVLQLVNAFELLPIHLKIPITSEKLRIRGIQITSIHPSVFKKYKHVKTIEIIETSIKEVPDGLQYARNLETITFSNNIKVKNLNNLNKIKDNVKSQISYLCLNNNKIQYIPSFISTFKALKYLNLGNNSIAEFPVELCTFPHLAILDLSDNEINTLPEYIGNLYSLEELYLGKNELNVLPDKIAFLQNLTILCLSDNYFDSVPVQVIPLQKLRMLKISNNNLLKLFSEHTEHVEFRNNISYILIYELKGYKKALKNELTNEAQNNLINKPENLNFACFSQLMCKILLKTVLLEKNLFRNCLPCLETLYLDENGLSKISKEIKYLKYLKKLYAQNNLIQQVSSELLNLTELTEIDLSSNWLVYLPRSVKCALLSKKIIKLNNNYMKQHGSKRRLGISDLVETGVETKFIGEQHEERLTFENQVAKHLKEHKHWNLDEIWKIKTDEKLLQNAAEISDKTMTLMWEIVIKHIVYSRDLQPGEAKKKLRPCEIFVNLSDENKYVKLVSSISYSGILDKIKKADNEGNKTEDTKLIQKVTDYLNSISYSDESCAENTIINQTIKAYIKLLFVHILNKVEKYQIESDVNEFNDTRTLVIELCRNVFGSCITGQSIKLQFYYSVICLNENPESTIEQQIAVLLGSMKEGIFTSVMTDDNDQNVHTIAAFRKLLHEKMGLAIGLPDPFPLKNNFTCLKAIGDKVRQFLEAFTIEKMISDMLLVINKNKNKVGDMRIHLHEIVKNTNETSGTDIDVYDYVCTKYFEYEEETIFANTPSEEKYKKVVNLKPEGLERILINMNLIVIKQTKTYARKKARLK